MDGFNLNVLVYVLGLALLFAFAALAHTTGPNLDHIPVIGPSGPFISFWGAIKSLFRVQDMMLEGYKKYPNGVFRIRRGHRWTVVGCGRQFIEDVRKAGDKVMSLEEALKENFRTRFTIGLDIHENPYHISVVRQAITRNMSACYPDYLDELKQAFEDELLLEKNEWKSIRDARKSVIRVICRASNRIYVGLPLCRDPDYIALNSRFPVDITMVSGIINYFPSFMRPIVGRCIPTIPSLVKRMLRHFSPIFEWRMQQEAQHGRDWPGKPNDAITWMLEKASPEQRNAMDLTKRILALNMGSIHTTALTFTHALYHLAAQPELAQTLREEVESVLKAEDGWSREAMDKMHKVDSFLKESLRVNPVSIVSGLRNLGQDLTLSNGITLPAGTQVVLPLHGVHLDETIYTDPEVFDPFRFSRAREQEQGQSAKSQLVSPTAEYLSWGVGQHACPGRFFAALMMKTMTAYILVNYDVKMKVDRVRPPNLWFTGVSVPDPKTEIMFRRRSI